MNRRLFTDQDVTPTESLLQKQLGSAYSLYLSVLAKAGEYRKQWQFSRGNGWILKVDDMQKTLFYLIAFHEGIEISLTVRDAERAEFLKNKECVWVFPQLESATKYSEGYALRFGVETPAECASVIKFLTELIKVRPYKGPLPPKPKAAKKAKSATKA
jgi:hypothetical protein